MRRIVVLAVLGLAVTGLTACGREPAADARAAAVDSVVPREEALRRFREGLPAVDSLTGGANSRDALVRQFVRALETRDTAAVRALVLNRAEFAWLYYPTNPEGLPPYDLSPGLMWFTIEGASAQGAAHVLDERAGLPLRMIGYRCEEPASVQGDNRVWGPCTVRRLQAPGDTIEERLFGPIVERNGRFKFVSLANKL